MKVKDLMSTNVTCIGENATMSQIAAHMKKENIGSIPVCDDKGRVKGIVTDRDLVLRAVARANTGGSGGADDNDEDAMRSMTSSDIMTKDPVTVSPNTDIHEAALLFSAHKVRRLPVVEASRLVGMLSLGDMAVKPVYIDEAGDALSAISLTGGGFK